MTGWIVLACYLLPMPFAWRSFALSLLEQDRISFPALWRDPVERRRTKGVAAIMAVILAALWPVALLARCAYRLARRVASGPLLEVPAESAEREAAELDELRKVARREGWSWPEIDKEGRR